MKRAFLVPLWLLASLPALAADQALGTLTVKGKTTVLKEVAAAEQADPKDPGQKWLVILASDRKVADADRTIARLTELARDGKLHAVRILWKVGVDTLYAVPYDAALPESGKRGSEHPTIDLKRYGDGRLDAEFKSKMLGQDWHFHANVKAAVAPGGIAEIEPEAEESADSAPATGADADKKALGKMGYAYTDSMFFHAVADGSLEGVRLFLKAGMSPNAHGKGDMHPMLIAAQQCSNQPDTKPRSEVLQTLTAAGGDVKVKDENGSTPLLWAVQAGCSPAAVSALLKAGADPNAKAKGGATPMMYAEIFQRTEIAEILRKAGAKK
jgi:Ankyrin repeats (3 copies)